jgi:mannose-6-phosphate isomerase-like protein (cupin superfamily)
MRFSARSCLVWPLVAGCLEFIGNRSLWSRLGFGRATFIDNMVSPDRCLAAGGTRYGLGSRRLRDCLEWRDAGGPPGPPRLIAPPHLHHRDDEAWYVLEGTLRVQVGKHEVEAGAGTGVFVPGGTPHWNPGPGPSRYLLFMTANIYRLIQEIHGMKERTPDTLRVVFKKYESELVS